MRKTRFILFVLVFMMFGVMNAEIASGTCGKEGDNITWVLDGDGTLTLSGSGEMMNYNSSNAPWHNNKIIEISISEGITSIGKSAFNGCRSLTSVPIPNSVTNIGSGAFADCSALTSIIIPNSVTSIGDATFYNCHGLTSVVIGNSVMSIGDQAFYDCRSLTSVTIGNSVTSIGDWAFFYCTALTSIIIPNSVTSIGWDAFFGCTSLTSITIGNSVTSIGDDAFFDCSSLTSIIVESGNTKYDSRDNCNAIISTETNTLIVGCCNTIIPNSVTSIGRRAFFRCSGLTSVTIPNSVTSIGVDAFQDCSGLTSVIIPNSVTNIGYSAFYKCTSLTSVTIGNSLTKIKEEAFAFCPSLTSVTIGSSVTIIEREAFDGCSGITTLCCHATIPPAITLSSFRDINYNHTILYVPKGSKNSYAFSEVWKNFLNIIELNDSDDNDKEYLMITKKNGEIVKIPMDDVLDVTPKQVETIEVEKIVEVPVYVYDDSRSEIILPTGETIVLTITNGIVYIEDAPMNEFITIYTVEGELYEATRVKEKITSFNLPSNAIYIIKVGEKTFKVKI